MKRVRRAICYLIILINMILNGCAPLVPSDVKVRARFIHLTTQGREKTSGKVSLVFIWGFSQGDEDEAQERIKNYGHNKGPNPHTRR